MAKAIYRVDTGEAYPSIEQAAKKLGVDPQRLGYAVKTGRKLQGTAWARVGQKPRPHRVNKFERPIICVETSQRYLSLLQASQELNVCPQSLYLALRKGTRCQKYHWQWAE